MDDYDLKKIIETAEMPGTVKVAITTVTKAISWLPWPFVIIGSLMKIEYFFYWLAFFIVIEGALFLALIYMLVLSVKYAFQIETQYPNEPAIEDAPLSAKKKEATFEWVKQGVIGNIAFYLFMVGAFIILKGMGYVDALFKAILDTLN